MQDSGPAETGDGEHPALADAGPAPEGDRPHRRSVTLLENHHRTSSIQVLTFGLPPDDPMRFQPGQYVTFYLARGGHSITRSYSIFSSGERPDRFSLLVKRVPGGFASNYLCDLDPGVRPALPILAPLGKFLLHPPGDRAVVLVATGVGLAPFVPMLERLRHTAPTNSVWLVWGNRYLEDLEAGRELAELTRGWTTFHGISALSRPPTDGSWSGRVGHVQALVRELLPDLSRAEVYVCGANAMVAEMQELCGELGCPKDRVYVDRWGESDD